MFRALLVTLAAASPAAPPPSFAVLPGWALRLLSLSGRGLFASRRLCGFASQSHDLLLRLRIATSVLRTPMLRALATFALGSAFPALLAAAAATPRFAIAPLPAGRRRIGSRA